MIDKETRKRAEQFVRNPAAELRVGSDNFHKAMPFVMKWEGGYVNDPKDPGGETKFGISKRAYPNLNIKELTEKDAYSVYYFDYWRPLHLDDVPFELAVSLFDAAINCGVGRVRSWLRELQGVEHFEKGRLTADQFNDRREKYYDDLVEVRPELNRFKKGWDNRVESLRKFIA